MNNSLAKIKKVAKKAVPYAVVTAVVTAPTIAVVLYTKKVLAESNFVKQTHDVGVLIGLSEADIASMLESQATTRIIHKTCDIIVSAIPRS